MIPGLFFLIAHLPPSQFKTFFTLSTSLSLSLSLSLSISLYFFFFFFFSFSLLTHDVEVRNEQFLFPFSHSFFSLSLQTLAERTLNFGFA